MKSLLVGNGINVQFGGAAYSNKFIVKRIIFNALSGHYDILFDYKVSGETIEEIFKGFVGIANDAISGNCDYLREPTDKVALLDFKHRYKHHIHNYYDVGLEDWLFLLRLHYVKNANLTYKWEVLKQGFERMILDAIINDGELSLLYSKMSKKVKRYFCAFDNIFTLNYDANIEELTKKNVFHLHGDFRTLNDSENPEMVEGFLRKQNNTSVVIPGYEHCFCNALLDYSGDLKYKHINDISKYTDVMKELLNLYSTNPLEYNQQLQCIEGINPKVALTISTYIENSDLQLGTNYHFKDLSSLTGELHIVGMSPNNDTHIFNCINESQVDKVYFYAYSKQDIQFDIHKPYELMNVRELWHSLNIEKKNYTNNYLSKAEAALYGTLKDINILSHDPITASEVTENLNSLPQYEIDRLYKLLERELCIQEVKGTPQNKDQFKHDFRNISRLALREGILPATLFIIYLMEYNKYSENNKI